MLTTLLRLLEESPDRFDLAQISRELGSQPSAVAGMIDTLVKMGRLEEINMECGSCSDCGMSDDCALSTVPIRHIRRVGDKFSSH
jgi:hypothetical protein